MTIFLGIILFFIVLATGDADHWSKIVPLVIFGLGIAALMMLSHWGWTP